MLRHARELLAVRSPLDAELIVSEILGTWWGRRAADGDVEEVVGEALVAHAARTGSPAALALLTGITCLGTRGQAARAERAALDLMDRGVARPIWADRVGMVEPRECYVSRDVYGDQESVICIFDYPSAEPASHGPGSAAASQPRPTGAPATHGQHSDAPTTAPASATQPSGPAASHAPSSGPAGSQAQPGGPAAAHAQSGGPAAAHAQSGGPAAAHAQSGGPTAGRASSGGPTAAHAQPGGSAVSQAASGEAARAQGGGHAGDASAEGVRARGTDRHALVVLVDRTKPGVVGPRLPGERPPACGTVRDAWVSSRIDRLLDHCRREAAANPLMRFEEIEPRDARALLQRCLDQANEEPDAPVDENFASYHAFVRHRVRALPTGGRAPQPAVHGPDQRATLATRFLASKEAADLSDTAAAIRCVDRIIDYGCTHDFGRPLRVSPVKCEMFLLDWLPRKVLLSQAEQEAVPHVLAAWVRWAGRRTGLPDEAVRATLDAVWDATAKFADAYRDPSAFGLDRELVDRLLPDGDLEALPRRAFALPFLSGRHRVSGRHGTIDLSELDPSDPADRRVLLELEHPGAPEEHLEAHERLADRLWRGDPPQLWETAQALLDVGFERHEVLHRLMAVLDRTGHDPRALRAGLRILRHEPPPG
ncbi:hypothetical protein [Actinomadura gamaensis]